MNDISILERQLPDTIEELSKFVFYGREKLTALKAAIKASTKADVVTDALEKMKADEQGLAEAVLLGESKIGELLNNTPKAINRFSPPTDGVTKTAKSIGINHPERYQTLAKHPDLVEQAIKEAREQNRPVRRMDVINRIPAQPKETHKQIIKKAREEHQDFKTESSGPVISFQNAIADKDNVKTLTENLEDELLTIIRKVRAFARFREMDEINDVISCMKQSSKDELAEKIRQSITILSFLEELFRTSRRS